MTLEDRVECVEKHYALNAAGDYGAAEDLVTDDFLITIPPQMPCAGMYRGKKAMRELIPAMAKAISLTSMTIVETTFGGDYAVVIIDFTLATDTARPVHIVEVLRFRDNLICEIRPYYFNPDPMITAATR